MLNMTSLRKQLRDMSMKRIIAFLLMGCDNGVYPGERYVTYCEGCVNEPTTTEEVK